jgi:ABC-2 type transport system permease protein
MKEFLTLMQDRRGRIALLMAPLIQMLVFGYAATFDIVRMPIAILNEDHGTHGRELAARFAGSSAFSIAALPTHQSEILQLVDRADVAMVVHIGQRFSADLHAGTVGEVQIITDGRRLNTAITLQSYASSVVAGFSRDYAAANGLSRPEAFTVTRAWHNPNLLSYWFAIPGLIGKLLLIANLAISAVSIARERESGGLEHMIVRRLGGAQILIGKAVPPIVIGLMQGTALAVVGAFWFDVPFRGSVTFFVISLIALLFTSTGVGMLISVLARTQRQATLGALLFVVPAVMLSGFATPISSMPGWMQAVTLFNPIRYFIAIMRGLFLRDADWTVIWPQLWPLGLIGLGAYLATAIILRLRA